MADVGRPTKFTEERKQIIYDALARGATYALCARLVGINEKTLYEWLKTGRNLRDDERDSYSDSENEFITFCNEFDRLESEYLLSLVEGVSGTNKQWMLTKRMKSEFDDTTNINLNAKVQTELSWKELIEKAKSEE